MGRNRSDELMRDVAKGAIAGAAATWVMGQATGFLYGQESQAARKAEDAARDGKTAYGVAAEKSAEALGHELKEDERKQYGSAIHWALGVGTGAVYGALRGRLPVVERGGGLLYGAAFWAAVDEGANTALGLTPGPAAFPWQTHARGLAGHLVFGVATHTALRLLDQVA